MSLGGPTEIVAPVVSVLPSDFRPFELPCLTSSNYCCSADFQSVFQLFRRVKTFLVQLDGALIIAGEQV